MTEGPIDIVRRKLLGGLLSTPAALPAIVQGAVDAVKTRVNPGAMAMARGNGKIEWNEPPTPTRAEVLSNSRRSILWGITNALQSTRDNVIMRKFGGFDPDIASMRSLSGCAKLRKQLQRNVDAAIDISLQREAFDRAMEELEAGGSVAPLVPAPRNPFD